DRDALVFGADPDGEAETAWPVAIGEPVRTPWGTLALTPLEAVPTAWPAGPDEEVAVADALAAPLVLRPGRAGHRVRPLGLDGTKRVSDLLTEAKVPPSERARQLVLCAGPDGEVVWVVGHRLAHGARLRRDTRGAVRLAWVPLDP